MGLAPSGQHENTANLLYAEVPVPIYSHRRWASGHETDIDSGRNKDSNRGYRNTSISRESANPADQRFPPARE
jgi:hypothetical protein